MTVVWIILGCALLLLLCGLLTAYICFYKIFYFPQKKKKPLKDGEIRLPDGEIYEPFREQITGWIKGAREMPHRELSVQSHDGLTLRGRYYELDPNAPIEILFHGYQGDGERDMSAGVFRSFSVGHSAIVVDQRASGRSEGNVVTFGNRESRDCIAWVNGVTEQIKPDAEIILTGISMGAATVLTAASREDLPKNVIGVLADCGYTSTKEIIQKVIRDMRLPLFLYFFARLGARLFGGFDPEETSPIESVKKTRLPIIFYHGDTDDFVPCEMSEKNYEACVSRKRLVIIKNAGHGLCYPVDPETYVRELKAFFG